MACPICHFQNGVLQTVNNRSRLQCERCGPVVFGHTGNFVENILGLILQENGAVRAANISHIFRSISDSPAKPDIDVQTISNWPIGNALPSPLQQIDELILLIGTQQMHPGKGFVINLEKLSAHLRLALDDQNRNAPIGWLLGQEETERFLNYRPAPPAEQEFRLTFDGWKRYAQLIDQVSKSRSAFMAMQFNDAQLNNLFEEVFRPAVRQAGFDLKILTDGQPAGSIDDQLRVAIRSARFVIADLTHHNRGAYWEAGFAEGLGKPVIYSCRSDIWNSDDKPHFDTNHLATIIWDPDDLQDAGSRLKAMVRVTLPDDAKMAD